MLISQRVFAILDRGVEAEHVGDIEFKGLARPVSEGEGIEWGG